MKTTVDKSEMKIWLRMPPTEDAELNANLTSLLITACTQVGAATGRTLVVADDQTLPETPEPIKTAIKFLVASWFVNPVPEAFGTVGSGAQAAVQHVVDSLISKYKIFDYPNTDVTA
jgi:hypothetical protein